MQGDPAQPMNFDVHITEVFFFSLANQIQEALKGVGYIVPAIPNTNELHMELIITLRDMAEREETKIAQTSRIAIAATSRTGRPTIPTFMAHS
eukprot:scaffold143796_cov39-Attheya_sp.AAC.1